MRPSCLMSPRLAHRPTCVARVVTKARDSRADLTGTEHGNASMTALEEDRVNARPYRVEYPYRCRPPSLRDGLAHRLPPIAARRARTDTSTHRRLSQASCGETPETHRRKRGERVSHVCASARPERGDARETCDGNSHQCRRRARTRRRLRRKVSQCPRCTSARDQARAARDALRETRVPGNEE
jgi:hypothetical protein